MKTMYYLESESRQKINDFHREKAYDRLREATTGSRPNPRPFRFVWKALAQLTRLSNGVLCFGQQGLEQAVNFNHSLDEA